MPTDDLSAPDPVGVVQDDVEGLDLGVRCEEGFGLGGGGTGGADGHGHSVPRSGSGAKNSVRISSKAAIRRSTWRFFVAGLTSIMLWKGAISAATVEQGGVDRCLDLRLVGLVRGGAVLDSGPGAQMNSTRAPTRTTCQGLCGVDDGGKSGGEAFGPFFHMGVVFRRHHLGQRGDGGRRIASGWQTAWCPCRNGRARVALPRPRSASRSRRSGPRRRWACRPRRICRRRTCRAERMDAGIAAKAGGDGMRLVDDQKRAVFEWKAGGGRRRNPPRAGPCRNWSSPVRSGWRRHRPWRGLFRRRQGR
jgi:hypothetical protein